jgi:dTDP-4-dehydrorhamnose 3,5-epimerase
LQAIRNDGGHEYTAATMQMNELAVKGVKLIDLAQFGDSRGSFCEAFRASWLGHDKPWTQWNVSRSRAGVIRGLHLHRRQTDYWHIVAGTVTAALVDVRPDSPTCGVAMTVPLCADKPQALWVPTGVLHGFHAHTDVILMYLLDQEYDPTDELGVRWDDPALGLPVSWYSIPTPVLSPRDEKAGMLKDLVR